MGAAYEGCPGHSGHFRSQVHRQMTEVAEVAASPWEEGRYQTWSVDYKIFCFRQWRGEGS